MTIYVIGMPASGKSKLGKKAAALLETDFIDLDRFVEEQEGKSIESIFAEQGEEAFREMESAALHSTSGFGGVVSCGGGVVLRECNRRFLSLEGLTVYRTRPIEHIVRELTNPKHASTRPLSRTREDVLALWQQRKELYEECADITLPHCELDDAAHKLQNFALRLG